ATLRRSGYCRARRRRSEAVAAAASAASGRGPQCGNGVTPSARLPSDQDEAAPLAYGGNDAHRRKGRAPRVVGKCRALDAKAEPPERPRSVYLVDIGRDVRIG